METVTNFDFQEGDFDGLGFDVLGEKAEGEAYLADVLREESESPRPTQVRIYEQPGFEQAEVDERYAHYLAVRREMGLEK